MILGAFVLLVAFFAIYMLSPFFDKNYKNRTWDEGPREREELQVRKEELLEVIRDLEYDFKMRKMSQTDYAQLKEKLTREAVEIIKKLDTVEGITKENAVTFAGSKQKSRKKVHS